jgi:hypothetical protein
MIMKKIFSICGAGAMLLMTACNQNLLNSQPTYEYSTGNFWNSEAAADAALSGCYAVLSYAGLYGGDATPLLEETASPNAYCYGNTEGWNSIAEGNQSASTGGIISSRWNECYEGIGRCNTLLDNVTAVPGMSAADKRQMRGQAYFLRALYYFNLENYWGDAPLILTQPNPKTQDTLSRTPREQVVQQIYKDLDSAIAILPWKYGSADLGRATKGAAMSLKGKLDLYEASPLFNPNNDQSRWQTAATDLKAVMDASSQTGYGLFPDYRALFLPENENNKEVIFDVQFIYPLEGNSFDLIDKQYNSNAPLKGLLDAYEMKNGLPITDPASGYDPSDPYANRDPRLYATVVYPGDTYMGETVSDSRFAITGYGVEKYSIYTAAKPPKDLADLKGGQSYTNYQVIRYADILLMYAEAQNEAVGPDMSVYSAINAVRERAGMPDIPAGLSQDQMRQTIRQERRIEFACEGYYYNDIRRWKTAETVMNAPINKYDGSQIEVRKFDPSRDYWWPIQQSQLDLDPKLKQNAGY